MAVRTKEELLGFVNSRFGDDSSDEVLGFIEDVSDTIADYESKVSDSTDWKQKYEENDAEWRQKYRDRFFSKEPDEEEDEYSEETVTIKTFDDLFKKEI